jgi:hypothetical protein
MSHGEGGGGAGGGAKKCGKSVAYYLNGPQPNIPNQTYTHLTLLFYRFGMASYRIPAVSCEKIEMVILTILTLVGALTVITAYVIFWLMLSDFGCTCKTNTAIIGEL